MGAAAYMYIFVYMEGSINVGKKYQIQVSLNFKLVTLVIISG